MNFSYKYEFLVKLKEIKNEFKHISFPTKREISQTILTVVILILLTCLCLWIIDSVLIYILSKLI
ncbi:MAG TPA: preprotein translocase subunit SecE [Candidatus Azoamicus sp. OHIO2]